MNRNKLFTVLSIIILIISISVYGCNSYTANTDNDIRQTGITAEKLSAQAPVTNTTPTPEVYIEPAKTTVFKNDSPQYQVNNLNINPMKVYYDNGSLVAECFITNGFTGQVIVGYDFNNFPIYSWVNAYDIEVSGLSISNADGVIAEGSFGYLNGARIAAGDYIIWTFIFEEDAVHQDNADLSYLRTQSQFSYKW